MRSLLYIYIIPFSIFLQDDDKLFANKILCNAIRDIQKKSGKTKDIIVNLFKDRTTYGDTPLHCALRYGQKETAKNILKLMSVLKSDAAELINIQNSSGKVGKVSFTFRLIIKINIYLIIIARQTPLHYAVTQIHPEITKALLMLGADPNVADHCGQMPLHKAVKCTY